MLCKTKDRGNPVLPCTNINTFGVSTSGMMLLYSSDEDISLLFQSIHNIYQKTM